jgi:hypothetical protein
MGRTDADKRAEIFVNKCQFFECGSQNNGPHAMSNKNYLRLNLYHVDLFEEFFYL